jgi:hypothetical protein
MKITVGTYSGILRLVAIVTDILEVCARLRKPARIG